MSFSQHFDDALNHDAEQSAEQEIEAPHQWHQGLFAEVSQI